MEIALQFVYNLIIGPLELFFEIIYTIAYQTLLDPGWSIVFLSLAMNILVLPLYRRADAMQEEERKRVAEMKPWIDHIKKTFSGDERFMMLQAYYDQEGYKQTDTLKGSLSLLLEIPFFIAAFHFLSNLEMLKGVSFGPIADLGAPDALISIGGLSINLLPILMTVINLVSAFIYMKGLPLRNKIQMYGIAAIFLVLLYASPAGLVFYWTLNNVFSLVKNLFYRMKNPKRALAVLLSLIGVALLVGGFFVLRPTLPEQCILIVVCALALQLPLVFSFIKPKKDRLKIRPADAKDNRTFLFCCLFLAMLTGLFIPLSITYSSPAEFVNTLVFYAPLLNIANSFALALGTFVLWFGVFYRLATPKGKTVFCYIALVMTCSAVVNYIIFSSNYGIISSDLFFIDAPEIKLKAILVNACVIVAIAVLVFFIWRKKRVIARAAAVSMCFAVAAVSVFYAVSIYSELADINGRSTSTESESPHFTLSKTGKNVVVIMLDRGISHYVPYIMNEKPEVRAQFEGFTYYPNSVSYGASTNFGAPGLYGGYDYIPQKMNERANEPLSEKHSEALKVMPVLFSKSGYNTTVLDPTYAGYHWIPDLGIYSDYPDISKYITMSGRYKINEFTTPEEKTVNAKQSRNFFCHSLFRTSPVALQETIYNKGNYNHAGYLPSFNVIKETYTTEQLEAISPQIRNGCSQAVGSKKEFTNAFAVLEHLPELTQIEETGQGGFLMMSNDSVHEPMLLQEPSYSPSPLVDNTSFDAEDLGRYSEDGSHLDFTGENDDKTFNSIIHYQSQAASFKELGNWLDYLRENGVYDNTRIIIVSDHGKDLGIDKSLMYESSETGTIDLVSMTSLLMVKDFNSSEYSVNTQFMTNADVPSLALNAIVENPVNPFTGNPIDQSGKYNSEILYSEEWDTRTNNGNQFHPGYWFRVHDNSQNIDNWEYLGMH